MLISGTIGLNQTGATVIEATSIFSLPATPESVPEGRNRIRDTLRSWELPCNEDLNLKLALVASELLTNAVRHAGGQMTICLDLDTDRLILSVHDSSPITPTLRRTPPDVWGEDNRGLTLIDAYSYTHGVERTPAGKRCWAVLPLPTELLLAEGRRTAGGTDTSRWVVEPAGTALLAVIRRTARNVDAQPAGCAEGRPSDTDPGRDRPPGTSRPGPFA